MKQQVSPVAAGVIILAVIGVVVFAWVRMSSGETAQKTDAASGGVPASAAQQLQQVMGGSQGRTSPGGGGGGSGPMTLPGR